ncbi:hypothetical protein SS50377_26217 [Spironucleus salmonicida]|uniref:Uncharacterized protein n=2 Tax=Spironucleus salmonicida TaxID=348837 RepID=A0A9P8RWW4_9EUKA|nr:hypothetical protein SS50377_26217 [Spironucleus salmonicida]
MAIAANAGPIICSADKMRPGALFINRNRSPGSVPTQLDNLRGKYQVAADDILQAVTPVSRSSTCSQIDVFCFRALSIMEDTHMKMVTQNILALINDSEDMVYKLGRISGVLEEIEIRISSMAQAIAL